MALAPWFANSYSSWNRTLNIRRTPYIAQANTRVSEAATAMATQQMNAVVIDMHTRNAAADGDASKQGSSLFGPNIGIVNNGPAWTNMQEKKMVVDELTQDIVKGWIEKSKDLAQPTTTLQALVNLKRPTIRLSPLQAPDGENPEEHHHSHGLEFEYDSDSPKCGIYVQVVLDSNHPDAPNSSSLTGLSKLLVYENVVEGGFGQQLKISDGAVLDLGRFESASHPSTPASGPSLVPPTLPTQSSLQTITAGTSTPPAESRSRRFTQRFNFRKRGPTQSVSGPALAVVNAEPQTEITAKKDASEDHEGVRVLIRIAALDEQGTEMGSPNEQVTYLHIVRYGIRSDEEGEDTRPWVVKVVKREATIGPHTFHLHEVYGLTPSTHHHAPTAPLPDANTYPPTASAQPQTQDEEEYSSECLVCLSSPREVVLLPCRHLVACKECALNMVEFGAGGQITQTEEPVAAPEGQAETEGAAPAEGGESQQPAAGGDATATTSTPAPATVTPPRRKRKAKGWTCPVCRQPYTALLRITTTPPTEEEIAKAKEDAVKPDTQSNNATDGSGGGSSSMAGLFNFRPAFMRNLTTRNTPSDVEAQAGRPVPTAA